MGQVKPKPSLFETGPFDNLSGVDVFSPTAVEKIATPGYVNLSPDKLKSMTEANLYTPLYERRQTSPLSDLTEAGISDLEVNGLIETTLPDTVRPSDLLQAFPELTLSELNTTLTSVSESLSLDSYLGLDTQSLITYVDEVTSALASNILCPDGGMFGLFDLGINLSQFMIDMFNISPCDGNYQIDYTQFALNMMPYVSRRLMDTSSELGLSTITGDIMTAIGQSTTSKRRSDYGKSILANYSINSMTSPKDYPGLGTGLVNDMTRIDPNWLVVNRSGDIAYSLTALGQASDDAKRVLGYDSDVSASNVIYDAYNTSSETIGELATKTYDYLDWTA